MKIQFTFLLLFFSLATVCSQTTLQGNLSGSKTGEPLVFATVSVYQNGAFLTGAITDITGDYYLEKIKPGTYDIIFSYTGYETATISSVEINENSENYLDERLEEGVTLEEVVVTGYVSRHRCGGCCYCVIYREENENIGLPVKLTQAKSLVYPNPTSSQFNIRGEIEIKDASIFNLSGQLVKTLKPGQKQVDVSNLSPGTYFLAITNNGTVQTEKIVVVRD